MLNRRQWLSSAFLFLAPFSSSKGLVESIVTDNTEKQRLWEFHPRYQILFSYEEWKMAIEELELTDSKEKFKRQANARRNLQQKVIQILTNPEKAFEFFTEREKQDYKSELNMLGPEEKVIARTEINTRYHLQLTADQFDTDGAKILWYFDRTYTSFLESEKQKRK
jgi:hypothetical protein